MNFKTLKRYMMEYMIKLDPQEKKKKITTNFLNLNQ